MVEQAVDVMMTSEVGVDRAGRRQEEKISRGFAVVALLKASTGNVLYVPCS